MKLKLVTVPNPLLRQVSQPITKIDKKIIQLVQNMIDTLARGPEGERLGVGLSAVQIGKPKRLFVIFSRGHYLVFINPQLTWVSPRLNSHPKQMEGCLSIPGLYGLVTRPDAVKIRFQNLDGQWQEKKFTGLTATVVQHEFDHLEGVLFIDHLLKQKGRLFEVQIENSEEKLVEIDSRLLLAWKK